MTGFRLQASRFRWAGACAVALLAGACKKDAPAADAGEIRVAAASDLSFAFKDVAAAFEAKTGTKVTVSFGASGLLEKQIAEGAPFDVFAAANVGFADDAVKSGACWGDTKTVYARGHLVMWSSKEPPKSLADLGDARFGKIAIANPDHAPYGAAAKQALVKAGLWEKLQPKVVFGENIQQTFQFAQSGNAEVAFVGLSLATATKDGAYTAVDESMHEPIDQALVVCKGAAAKAEGAPNAAPGSRARAFAAFVASADGRAIMKKYGFLLPGESMADSK